MDELVNSIEFDVITQNPSQFKKVFKFKCYKPLSTRTKCIITNWKSINKGKGFYHAVDDILYLLNFNPAEQNLMLQLFNSMAIFLQNNMCISFFDVIIDRVSIEKVQNVNRFLKQKSQNLKSSESINFTLICLLKPLPKKPEISW